MSREGFSAATSATDVTIRFTDDDDDAMPPAGAREPRRPKPTRGRDGATVTVEHDTEVLKVEGSDD